MATAWRTVRVFISSTFKDMQAERDHLVRFVFPRLREELLRRRMHFVDVDLRWGVTSEQDAQQVCREIIDECRPRFLCMLGGRYGWTPPGRDRSITADEVHYAALDQSQPDRHRFFYFRDPAATAAMVEEHPGQYREPPGSETERRLEELKQAILGAGYEPFVYPAQWNAQQGRLVGLEEFGRRVYEELLASIDEEFGTEAPEPVDEFAEEMARQEAFVSERTARYVVGSRQPILDRLAEFASTDGEPSILAVTGAPGSGKSALLGKAYQELTTSHPDWLVVPHFVGASAGSTDLRRSLKRLCHELQRVTGDDEPLPDGIEELISRLLTLLEQAGGTRRVVLVMDALNQMDPTDAAHTLRWLPRRLPQNVRIVVSSLAHPVLDALRLRREQVVELELAPLTSADARAIAEDFADRYHKRLSEEQLEALLAKPESGSPLYLLVALEELRTLGTYEEITARIEQLPGSIRELFLWILQERLSADPGFQDAEGNLVGAELVRKCVSHLGVSRHGLSHAELAGTVDPGDARGNVAALERLLRPYLMRRGELLDFYHGQLREAVEAEYLDEEHERVEAHRSLAGHFRDRTDPTKDSSWAGDDPRGFSELCYHQTQGQMWSQLEATLCDLKFVEVRCLKRMLFDVLRDCDEATRAHDLPAVTQLRNALWLEVDGLIGRPELATQSLYNRLIWFDRSGPVQRAELDKARSRLEEKRCWLSAEAPLPEGQAQGTSSIPFQITSTVQSVCLATQSVAIAAPDGDLEVRDLNYGRLIERRRLTALRIATIVLCEDNSLAAYMDVDGTVRSEDGLASVPGRKGEKRLAYASTVGVLAVREDGALIAWHPQHAGTRVLRSRIPAPLVALQIAPDEQSVLFVAGFRSQVVGLCTRDGEVWSTAIVPYDGPPAMDAKADWAAGRLLLACQDRCLRIIDTASGTESAHLAYERRKDALLRGVPAKCDWGSGRSRGLAFLATRQGHLAAWDWKNDVLEPLDEYCTASDLAMLCLFEVLPQSGRLVLTFPDRALVVSREGRRHSRRHHSAAVTDCALTEAGKVASISEGDRTIRWNKVRGLEQEAVHATYNLTPTAVALTHRPGAVLIGTREGQVWQQEPGITTPLHEIDQIFAERIVSLFATSDSEASIAARSGSVRWKDFASGREEVLWHARRGQHQRKIIPAGSWGRYWSFYDDADRGSTVLSLVTGTDRETVVFDSHRGLADVAVSPDGSLLCLAGDGVEVWRHSGGRWSCAWRRPGFACHIAFAEGGNLLAVAAREPWLEIWQVAEDLPTLAAQRIPGRITCLAAVGEVIAIGLSTGELISLRLHQSG